MPFDILLVEDDKVDAQAVLRAFGKFDDAPNITWTVHGREALDALVDCSCPDPHLILLDLNMPVMSGLEFLHEIKSVHPEFRHIPTVILTTCDEEVEVQYAYDKGAAGYFSKPTSPAAFQMVIKTIWDYWRVCRLPVE